MPAKSKPRKTNRKPAILVMDTGNWSSAASAVKRAGGEPILCPPRDVAALDELVAKNGIDGLLLTGGGDVDPRLYGQKPHKKVYGVSEIRDYVEWTALDFARDNGIPVLGICRGSQLMAVHNGGTLRQHIDGHRGTSHLVFGESGSRFRRIIGAERGYFVSLHHQVVARHGNGWRVAARSAEGHIEAVESKDGRCLGVQFHPEMDYTRNPEALKLFVWLAREAAKRANLVKPKPTRAAIAPARAKVRAGQRQLPARPRSDRAATYSYGFERYGDDHLQRLAEETANVQPLPRPKPRPRNLNVRWVCRDCGLQFDKQQDRDDHEYWICGTPQMRTTEPPPGHPDWLPEDPKRRAKS